MKRLVIMAGLLAGVASASAAGLRNEGFETKDLGSWQAIGEGWRPSNYFRDSRGGAWAAVNDVWTNASDTYRIIHQEIKASPGKTYQASVWLRTVCVESSESFLEIQFMDKEGNVLRQFQSERLKRDEPFKLLAIERMEAPEMTARVSVRGVVFVSACPTVDTDYHVFDKFDFRLVRNPSPGLPR